MSGKVKKVLNTCCRDDSIFGGGGKNGSHEDFRNNIQDGVDRTDSEGAELSRNDSLSQITSHTHGSSPKSDCTNWCSISTSCQKEWEAWAPVDRSDTPHTEGNLHTSINQGREGYESTSVTEPEILLFDISTDFERYKYYEGIVYHENLSCCTEFDFSYPANVLGSQMHIPGWRHELSYENDINLKNYLSFGIENGFLIIDEDCTVPSYECSNYSSVLTGPAFDYIDEIIGKELACGKYVVTSSKPHCVHSLGAVPKKGSAKWRPITDCKRPIGTSINSYMSTTFHNFCYTTIDNVIEMLNPGTFMASVDISAAYRSILIHPSQWKYQGISWKVDGNQTYLLDTHLCFGLRCAPYLFTQISNFVIRCLRRRGFTRCTAYLDDFFVTGSTENECRLAQQALISILRSLGFFIAWDKCISPTQEITYLGISLNTREMSVKIPSGKMQKLRDELKFFSGKKRATVKQIQRLCGILAHCSKIIKGGRTFSHRIIELLKGWHPGVKRIRLSDRFRYDISWWESFASIFNGKNLMVKHNFGQGPLFTTDSCIEGYGLWTEHDWQAGYFNCTDTPNLSTLDSTHSHWVNVHLQDKGSCDNINVLELIPVWLSLVRCAATWRDLHVVCLTDNSSVMAMINKGCSTNEMCMILLRDIFWRCAINNVHLTARHISGNLNVVADSLSRVKFNGDLSFLDYFLLCCSNQNTTRGHGKAGHALGINSELGLGGLDPQDSELPVVAVY